MTEQKPIHILVIYHKNCTDGFGAAWAMYDFFENVQGKVYDSISYMSADYGDEPPDNIENMCVYIVDFSYSRNAVLAMAEKAESVTVIDHHKTAKEELENLEHKNLTVVFDMEKSGAVLAWEYLHDGYLEPPYLLRLIEDRDLWKFEYQNTKPALAALRSRPFDFKLWTTFMRNERAVKDVLVSEGYVIQRAQTVLIQELIDNHTRMLTLILPPNPSPYVSATVPILNCPGQFASEAGHLLCGIYKNSPFSTTYYDDVKAGKRIFSLRSTEGGFDVSEIAKLYGGGGHKHAAGFKQKLPTHFV